MYSKLFLLTGLERLAGITLNNPVHIDTLQTDTHPSSDSDVAEPKTNFTIPQNLKQLFIITPPKLRLVSLTAFITWHCKVCIVFVESIVKFVI